MLILVECVLFAIEHSERFISQMINSGDLREEIFRAVKFSYNFKNQIQTLWNLNPSH